ncbi:hypothetical protein [Streptomyces sp. NPDC085596]|uniref:hypothetical protein n=1 Tax=Streptomyces sp. NPDC085596 TaxID=3365731 RepID=UPI0037D6A19C
MTRLQILQLPEGAGDDRPPFVLVIDQCQGVYLDMVEMIESHWRRVGEEIGARGTLIFMESVDISVNETNPASAQPRGSESREAALELDRLAKELYVTRGMLDADDLQTVDEMVAEHERLRAQRDEARQWARHGYEIGQKHCGWSDHGVAPSWLTDGWPPHIDSCEHLKLVAEFDEAITRVRSLPTEPEIMDARQEHPGVWLHGYKCGVLAVKSALRPRDEETVKP